MKHIILLSVASGALALGAYGQDASSALKLDNNGDGYVTESEVVRFKMTEDGMLDTEARTVFAGLDADGSGALSPEELEAANDDSADAAETAPD